MKHSNDADAAIGAAAPEDAAVPDTPLALDPEAPGGPRRRAHASGLSADTNNDGEVDVEELKKIVHDLKESKWQQRLLTRMTQGSILLMLVLLFGNIGLIWALLVFTRQLGASDGHLVDSSTGRTLGAKLQGNRLQIDIASESARRLAGAARGLGAGQPHLVGIVTGCDFSCLDNIYNDQIGGTPTTATMQVGTTTFSGSAASGAIHAEEDGCHVYSNIHEEGSPDQLYQIDCCGDNDCALYKIVNTASDTASRGLYSDEMKMGMTPQATNLERQCNALGVSTYNCATCHENGITSGRVCKSLFDDCRSEGIADSDCQMCFSPMSTVTEQTKGRMLLKDLEFGDRILAAGGVFRPAFIMHSSRHAPTRFLQIHAGPDGDAPLEVTPDHLVFLHPGGLPVAAAEVKVGDALVGVDGPRAVTGIGRVTRAGLVAPLSSDATHFVDGVLASSAVKIGGSEKVALGPVEVHIHPFTGRVFAPLLHALCEVSARYCTAQVDDGAGGQINVMAKLALHVNELSAVTKAAFLGVLATVVVSHYLAWVVLPGTVVLGCIVQLKVKKQKVV